ncbi:hypothetical protein [Demequina sp.]|uniref:hypothetical protein n=1 Tax=Demequina sp. TaxID=2050685 RepID=UPI003A85E873
MGACDVTVRTDFPIAQDNPLERIVDLLETMVEEQRQDNLELVRQLRDVIEDIRRLARRPVVSWRYPNPAENLLFNLWLDYVVELMADLESRIEELEATVASRAQSVRTFVEGAGNPRALVDVARLLREGVGQLADNLANEVTLAKLAVDNRWHSQAANAYAEASQRQTEQGFEELVASANALATFLDEHAATEVDFWDNVSGMISEFALVAVGLYVSGLGVAASIVGLVIAIPTGGIGLIVSVAGLVISALGLIISAIGAWLFVDEMMDLIPTTDASLSAGLDTMSAAALPAGPTWPVLAR